MSNDELVSRLEASGTLRTPRLVMAFRRVDRARFVPPELRVSAYEDRPLPIGVDATISQPTTVAIMLELLQPAQGDRVLDVGSGSGWTTALLAAVVGPAGSVLGTEISPELVEMGARNIGDLSNASIAPAGPEAGLPGASFQRILVSATAPRVPPALLDQLAPGGTMVMPVGDALHTLVKMEDGEVRTDVYPGFVFVPLKNGARP